MIGRLATEQIEDELPSARRNGAIARSEGMTAEERAESARKAGQARWAKHKVAVAGNSGVEPQR